MLSKGYIDFQRDRKTKKNASSQGTRKSGNVSTSFRKVTWREKTRLKKVSYLLTYLLTSLLSQLVSQTEMCSFTCSCIVLSTSF